MIRLTRKQRVYHKVVRPCHCHKIGLALFLCLSGCILVFDVCFVDGKKVLLPSLQFLLSYPARFVAFYESKFMALATQINNAIERLNILEQVNAAWNFTVALITLVCVHQIAETIRLSVVSRLRAKAALNLDI